MSKDRQETGQGILFNQLPLSVCQDRQLSAGAKLTYGAIYTIRAAWGRVDPSRQELADRTGQSVRTVQRALNELESAGWIQKRHYKSGRGTLRTVFIVQDKKLLSGQS